AELFEQFGGDRRQIGRLGLRFARHKVSLGACYALNTKLLTGPLFLRLLFLLEREKSLRLTPFFDKT
ncbi:hypothetical protein KTE26_16315, partial [Ralstonia mannitolilytica]|uniref:hypothetical protein n=1 Tax=Ralstonia mannitolilytica TaxID=105219 RepID=UPI001C247675